MQFMQPGDIGMSGDDTFVLMDSQGIEKANVPGFPGADLSRVDCKRAAWTACAR